MRDINELVRELKKAHDKKEAAIVAFDKNPTSEAGEAYVLAMAACKDAYFKVLEAAEPGEKV